MRNVRLCDICGKVIQRYERRVELVVYSDETHQNLDKVSEVRYDICESCYFNKIRDMIKVEGEDE